MLTTIPPGLENVMNIDPRIFGGEPCFNGTRVPLETVVDNLAAGHSTGEILGKSPFAHTRTHPGRAAMGVGPGSRGDGNRAARPVKILLDDMMPERFARYLIGHAL